MNKYRTWRPQPSCDASSSPARTCPLHELRRRFELNGQADDVCPVRVPDGLVYVGLPQRESDLLAELVRCGDVGLELCRDPLVPIVMGVFPMRPVVRG